MLTSMRDGASSIVLPNGLPACHTLIQEQSFFIQSQSQSIAAGTLQLDAEKHLVESHVQTIVELAAKNKRLEQEKEADPLRIQELLRLAFARRSERYLGDPNQLKLDFGQEAQGAAEGLAEAIEESGTLVEKHIRRKKKKRRDEGLPEHLPRYEVEADVPAEEKECPEHGPRQLIGYDTTETLEFERPQLKVRVTKYPKYACENASPCGVKQAGRPTGLVEGDRYDASIATEIITNKYGYHLPVYRQQDLFAVSVR